MMENEKILKRIKKYLKGCKLMQVSISKNNKPRIFNCWFSYDQDWNFHYISPNTANHSKELIKNPNVGVSIVSPKMAGKGVGPGVQGLMFEGIAEQVKGKELFSAYINFLKKYPKVVNYIKLSGKKVQMKGTKIYKIAAKKGIWFDNITFDDARREVKFN